VADRQTYELTLDEVWALEQYRQARACRFATLEIKLQDAWPVNARITKQENGPRKEAV
jgi:hypothetical protein